MSIVLSSWHERDHFVSTWTNFIIRAFLHIVYSTADIVLTNDSICIVNRSNEANHSMQPRPQGFSLKMWVGKSPGDEVALNG